jgi:hypothetical protein
LQLNESNFERESGGASSGLSAQSHSQPLPPIPGTPASMSLSRSPSPLPGGGWSSPGLTSPYAGVSGRSSPTKSYGDLNGGANSISWASAKAKSNEVNGYPAFSTKSNSFFGRHARRLSHSLPSFNIGGRRDYADKEKLGRGRWSIAAHGRMAQVQMLFARIGRRMRIRLMIMAGFLFAVLLFYVTRKSLKSLSAVFFLQTNLSDSSPLPLPPSFVPWRWL